jgi:signal transduction histidine kinase
MRISFILIIAMFGIFLTFAIYGMITFDLSIQEIKKLLGSRNEGFAFNMMQDLDRYIDKRLNDLEGLTQFQIVHDTLVESNKKFRTLSDVKSFSELHEQVVFDPSIDDSFITGELEQKLEKELAFTIQFYRDEYGYDVIEELLITNEFGANVASNPRTYQATYNSEEWWQIAKNTSSFIGDLEYRKEFESYDIRFAFRVDDQNNNFLGVMRAELTLDDVINEFIDDAEIIDLPNRHAILLDNQGRIIYRGGIQDFTKAQPVPYFDQIMQGGDVGTISLTDEFDQVRLISYAKSTGYKEFPGFDWVVLVEQPTSSFVEEFVELRGSIFIISIIGMMSSVGVGVVVSFFITNPLKNLSNLAESISQGKFNVKTKKSKINEIEIIGQSFNKMSESLQKLIETEKRLAETQAKIKNERLAAIGEMAASMAHNMKNPLGTIRSTAEIVKRNAKSDNKEIDEVLNRMDKAIDRMSRQIEDVLNFVRITPLNEDLVSIRTLLDGAIDSLEIPKNVVVKLPETNLKLKCDAKKIEIVFMNLILNAIQAIGGQQGTVTVQVKEENGFAVIEVQDTGSGIPENIMPKIFEPLTTTKEKGTGLGLATCKNIIEQHGGSIAARNNPTTFSIRLPLNNE